MPAARSRPHARVKLRSLRGVRRAALVTIGAMVIGLGVVITPVPGPGGIPVMALGLMLVLRNSPSAKRRFVRLHRRYPRAVGPVRRVLRGLGKRR